MKHLLMAALCLCGLLCLAACHKHDTNPKQYSTWIVNGQDTFRTNNVDTNIYCNPDHSYCAADLRSNDDLQNWFDLAFDLDYFPTSEIFELDTNTITPGELLCSITFYYNGIFYYHTPHTTDTIYASSDNGRTSYSMPACWFVNYNNPTGDSILIQGTFNIP